MSRDAISLDLTDVCFVKLPNDEHEGARTQLAIGDLLVSITADIGIVSYVGDSLPLPAYINQHIALVRLPADAIDSRYAAYFLALGPGQRTFRAVTDQGAKAGINLQTVCAIPIVTPNKISEQRAIATALSDVDALLGAQDQLIVKKRDIKQATMQQLLTGETRLHGFSEAWKAKRLGSVAEVLKGGGLSRSMLSISGKNACVLYGELFTTYGRVITSVVSRTDSVEGVRSVSGDVLMPGSTTTTGIDLATASALMIDDILIGGDINIIRCNSGCLDPAFLANYLTQAKRQTIAALAQGITIHHLYGRDLKALPLNIPPVAEQVAIASVLSDMDTEIEALEAQRTKTHDLKLAMMQELLTGKTRLVQLEAAHV